MMLSRLILNPGNREVLRCVIDAQKLHRLVMSGFGQGSGGSARAEMGVLHRLEADHNTGRFVLYVQSRSRPDWSLLRPGVLVDLGEELENPGVRIMDNLLASLRVGTWLAFRLRANVTRKVDTKSSPEGEKRNGQRVPLRDYQSKVAWLERHAEAGGFALSEAGKGENELRVIAESLIGGQHPKGPLTLAGTLFEGLLRVKDPAIFRQTIERGIGPAKAFGFGLLSIGAIEAT